MYDAGILGEEDRIELLNGELILMSPVGSQHGSVVKRLNALFNRTLQGKAIVSVQDPILIPPHSEPEPDLALLQIRDDFYEKEHPSPDDIFIVLEVADTTLEKDRIVKSAIYAEAGIPEYWIVNLPENRLEIYSQIQGNQYQEISIFAPGEKVSLDIFGLEINISDILP
jgi:Uma2 family endonuclease